MKKTLYIALLAFCSLAVPAARAQASTETVTVNKSDLTPAQLKAIADKEAQDKIEIEQKEIETKIGNYGKWVGIGHELGTAVNESLTAITTNANTFANSTAGHWTIALVVWKVIGADAIHLVLGFGLLAIGIPVWIFSFYQNCITRTVTLEKGADGVLKKKLINVYESESGKEWVPVTLVRFQHFGALALFLIFVFLIVP
jgi:hypothetical protein